MNIFRNTGCSSGFWPDSCGTPCQECGVPCQNCGNSCCNMGGCPLYTHLPGQHPHRHDHYRRPRDGSPSNQQWNSSKSCTQLCDSSGCRRTAGPTGAPGSARSSGISGGSGRDGAPRANRASRSGGAPGRSWSHWSHRAHRPGWSWPGNCNPLRPWNLLSTGSDAVL